VAVPDRPQRCRQAAPDLAAAAAEKRATELSRAIDQHEKLLAEHRAEVRRLDLERIRWRDRLQDLRRQLGSVDQDRAAIAQVLSVRAERSRVARAQAAGVEASLPGLREVLAQLQLRLVDAERESPEEDAELAAGARKLATLEEARMEARLKVGALEGNLGLVGREVELLGARMEEIRARMPEGMAPEEVPGGKAREREMRQLERRLEEIGPTNALAGSECAELQERYQTLQTQLEDIGAARK